MKPYVVSADIYLLMKRWAIQHGFMLPTEDFFCQLRKEFSNYMKRVFSSFELVSEHEIAHGITRLIADSGLPVISLDRVYSQGEFKLEIARLVDERRENCGLGRRDGTPPLIQQIRELQTSGLREAIIVDDVVFSGTLLERVINLLSRIKICVPLVCAGIGIAEGISHLNQEREVRCVHLYEAVVDQVCERDFYPGVPLSGRLLVGDENIGVPYLLPFGKPESWASIPAEHATAFSQFCLNQTIMLFEEIERYSGKPVSCRDLGRKVIGLPMNETRYIDTLYKLL